MVLDLMNEGHYLQLECVPACNVGGKYKELEKKINGQHGSFRSFDTLCCRSSIMYWVCKAARGIMKLIYVLLSVKCSVTYKSTCVR